MWEGGPEVKTLYPKKEKKKKNQRELPAWGVTNVEQAGKGLSGRKGLGWGTFKEG